MNGATRVIGSRVALALIAPQSFVGHPRVFARLRTEV
jgi:hypothetical protein